ncbi:hypothetical protein H9639_11215 [Arthrobacter sp. Sa2CUA1]|uniref:FDX-ACB domain-containing protein n=1 Tax=Arthrobacter gallicola TaxID=2762225 RepID=A0ABR8UU18_9MICC|nr:hypothetical protein [Arthrobacter gallicola]
MREGAGELLEDIALFDVYAGKGIDEGHKSLAFALRFRAADRTLTADEASESVPPPSRWLVSGLVPCSGSLVVSAGLAGFPAGPAAIC